MRHLSFVFVLLGAGKTTTFGMLTGEFPITAGTAYLDGYNIQTQLRQVGKCAYLDGYNIQTQLRQVGKCTDST